jgi:Golgi nucleoside diphosphatase
LFRVVVGYVPIGMRWRNSSVTRCHLFSIIFQTGIASELQCICVHLWGQWFFYGNAITMKPLQTFATFKGKFFGNSTTVCCTTFFFWKKLFHVILQYIKKSRSRRIIVNKLNAAVYYLEIVYYLYNRL